MKNAKQIKISVRRCFDGSYRVEKMVNTVVVPMDNKVVRVGDKLNEDQVATLCGLAEVTVHDMRD